MSLTKFQLIILNLFICAVVLLVLFIYLCPTWLPSTNLSHLFWEQVTASLFDQDVLSTVEAKLPFCFTAPLCSVGREVMCQVGDTKRCQFWVLPCLLVLESLSNFNFRFHKSEKARPFVLLIKGNCSKVHLSLHSLLCSERIVCVMA